MFTQEPSSSTLFSKSSEKVKGLLPRSEYDEIANALVDAEAADWDDGTELRDDRDRTVGILRRRGLCMNTLDITDSVTDLDWLDSTHSLL